jgi:hypothetical protein
LRTGAEAGLHGEDAEEEIAVRGHGVALRLDTTIFLVAVR